MVSVHAEVEAASLCTLYKIDKAECGQATLDCKYSPYAERFTPLQEGKCADVGYTAPDGKEALRVPVLGEITVEKFRKPTALATGSNFVV